MNHWRTYHAQWEKLGPPLRPSAEVVAGIRSLVGSADGRVFLLGVTPELAGMFPELLAMDKNPAMIANLWPGDTGSKKAIAGDWLEIRQPAGSFAAIVGDGSLNNIAHTADIARLLGLVLGLLRPGGRFACRLFERPARPFTVQHLMKVAWSPAPINFHAFKWQLAMLIGAEEGASVPVARILERFEQLFPDRDGLSERTGWPRQAIDTIDIYRGSPVVYSFPNRAEFLGCIPAAAGGVEFHPCGGYDLAACCPILTFVKRPD
ncbi:MAG: methyltransferase type 11 [Rhizobiales bacterium]|nr:methyltransferase type 11 [Hyphomicrobiales bacterium]MBI3673949.1 methyltransferase type 11 [Hyphomicrobiales bacterium]